MKDLFDLAVKAAEKSGLEAFVEGVSVPVERVCSLMIMPFAKEANTDFYYTKFEKDARFSGSLAYYAGKGSGWLGVGYCCLWPFM